MLPQAAAQQQLPAANRKAPAHAYVLLSVLATNRTMWTRLLLTLLALGIRSVQLSATDTGPLRSSSFRDSPSAWLSRPAGMVIWASSLECRQRAGSTALVKQARRRKAAHCLPRNTLLLHAWPLARPPETQDELASVAHLEESSSLGATAVERSPGLSLTTSSASAPAA